MLLPSPSSLPRILISKLWTTQRLLFLRCSFYATIPGIATFLLTPLLFIPLPPPPEKSQANPADPGRREDTRTKSDFEGYLDSIQHRPCDRHPITIMTSSASARQPPPMLKKTKTTTKTKTTRNDQSKSNKTPASTNSIMTTRNYFSNIKGTRPPTTEKKWKSETIIRTRQQPQPRCWGTTRSIPKLNVPWSILKLDMTPLALDISRNSVLSARLIVRKSDKRPWMDNDAWYFHSCI